jgi:hypothetical protein
MSWTNSSFMLRLVRLAPAMSLLIACPGDGPKPKKPVVHSGLEDVQVAPAAGTTPGNTARAFQLSGWYRGDSNNVVSGPGPLVWELQLEGGSTTPTGEVTVATFPQKDSKVGQASIGDGSAYDVVTVTAWANAAAASTAGDVLEITEPTLAAASSGATIVDPPSVALVESQTSGKCQWDRPLAFVGAVSVGEQADMPCSVALFFARYGMLFQSPITELKWKDKGARFLVTPTPPLLIKTTIFLAVDEAAGAAASAAQPNDLPRSAQDLAELDVSRANMIFETSRAGIRIDPQYKKLSFTPDLPIRVGADPYDCVLAFNLPSNPAKSDYAYDSSGISVYYVDRINFPMDPVQPRVRGIECHHWYSGNPNVGDPPGRGPVVFISYSHHSPVTLAHEIGHALGLNDEEGRISNRDVMNNLLPDGPLGADARSNLTVGQAFRMNVWDDSWLNTRVPQPTRRACDAQEPCPPIETNPDDY